MVITQRLSILLFAAFLQSSGSVSATQGPEILGVMIGHSTLFDVLGVRGPADSMYLAQHELEEPEHTTDVLFSSFTVDQSDSPLGPGRLVVVFDNESYIARSCNLDFLTESGETRLLPVEVMESFLGRNRRVVRHALIFSAAGLEGELSECEVKDGSVETWIYKDHGAQVYPKMDNGRVLGIYSVSFSGDILSGKRDFPPCKVGGP